MTSSINGSHNGYQVQPHVINAENGRIAQLREQWRRFVESSDEISDVAAVVEWFQVNAKADEVYHADIEEREQEIERLEDELKAQAEPTKVTFRRFPIEVTGVHVGGGDVIALFPDRPWGKGSINSYQHSGQHSAASVDLLHELESASVEEISELMAELYQIGYRNLLIV
jgi:hypothetical protein